MNKRTLLIAILAVALLAVIAIVFTARGGSENSTSQGGNTLSITHAQGTTPVPANPQKVVVFDVGVLDTMDALGAKAIGTPTARYPDYLAQYAGTDAKRVGTLFEPDYETIVAMQPDLIIVGGRAAAKYNELSKIAPTIDLTVDRENYIASTIEITNTLGRIFGKEKEAADAVKSLQASVDALKAKTANAGKALVILTTGGRMSAYGPGSRFGVAHKEFGFAPARPDLNVSNHGESINAEFILETDPDWLLVVDRDAATGQGEAAARQVLNNELVNRTKAARNNRIVYLDPLSWYIVAGGLRSTQTMIKQLDDAVSASPAA